MIISTTTTTGACYDFFFRVVFRVLGKKKNRNKPLWPDRVYSSIKLSHDVMSILNMARVIIDYLIVNVKWEGMTI